MGRLRGALNRRAEDFYALLDETQQEWAKRICLKLVRTGQDAKDTRQRQPQQKLLSLGQNVAEAETIQQVINKLVNRRLLVTDKGKVIDLAHEALMTGW